MSEDQEISEKLRLAKERRNALRRKRYAEGDGRKENNREWKQQHAEEVRAAGREYQRLRRLEDPESVNAIARKYYHTHKEKARERYNDWYQRNPGYHTEWNRQNRKKNPVLYLWRSARSRAKAEGILFNIELEDIVVPEFCPALGIKLALGGSPFGDDTASIDRIIPGLGYVKGNIAVISIKANVIKRNTTPDELEKVAAYARRETERVLRENGV